MAGLLALRIFAGLAPNAAGDLFNVDETVDPAPGGAVMDGVGELQPELFIEIGAALAQERGIRNLDFVRVSSPRHQIRARALVTNRIGVMTIAGKQIHHVGMPWHWGWQGLAVGDVVNWPVELEEKYDADARYRVGVRAGYRRGNLPSSLRALMPWSDAWNRSSEWNEWILPR